MNYWMPTIIDICIGVPLSGRMVELRFINLNVQIVEKMLIDHSRFATLEY